MSSVKIRALVLNSIKWKDSSRIVTLFTEERGRIKVIVHGVAREKSRFRGKLETLNLVECLISYRKSRSLQVLTEAMLLHDFRLIKNEFIKMAFGFAILETIDSIFQEEETDNIFFQFVLTIFQNMEKSATPELIWWYFLIKIASYLGFKPGMETCSICGNSPKSRATLALQKGVIYCQDCAAGDGLVKILPYKSYIFLKNLQNENYNTIGISKDSVEVPHFDYTNLLLEYLNLHLGHELKLKSLSLIQENANTIKN